MDRTSGHEGMNEQLREDGEALGISPEGIETAINEADSLVDAGGFTEEQIEDESAAGQDWRMGRPTFRAGSIPAYANTDGKAPLRLNGREACHKPRGKAMKLAKKDGNWVIPVQVVVDGNKSEQEARKSVGDLLAQGVGYCADPGSIESYKIGTQAAK